MQCRLCLPIAALLLPGQRKKSARKTNNNNAPCASTSGPHGLCAMAVLFLSGQMLKQRAWLIIKKHAPLANYRVQSQLCSRLLITADNDHKSPMPPLPSNRGALATRVARAPRLEGKGGMGLLWSLSAVISSLEHNCDCTL